MYILAYFFFCWGGGGGRGAGAGGWGVIGIAIGLQVACRLLTAKSWSVRGASHQPAFMGSCLTISHKCLSCLPSRWVSPCLLCPLIIGLMVVLLAFFGMASMVLVLWELVLFYGMDVEFKGYYRRVKWQQDFTLGIGFYVYNVVGLPRWMDHNGVIVNMSEFQSSRLRLFPGSG